MNIPPLCFVRFARPASIIQRGIFWYSVYRHLRLLVSPALLGDLECFIKLMPAYYLIKKRTTSSSDAGLPSAVITFIPRVKGVRSIKKGKSPFGATVLSP